MLFSKLTAHASATWASTPTAAATANLATTLVTDVTDQVPTNVGNARAWLCSKLPALVCAKQEPTWTPSVTARPATQPAEVATALNSTTVSPATRLLSSTETCASAQAPVRRWPQTESAQPATSLVPLVSPTTDLLAAAPLADLELFSKTVAASVLQVLS